MKNKILYCLLSFILCIAFSIKVSAQLSLSAGIQHVQVVDKWFYGFEPLPSFFTLRKDINHTFSGEVYFSYINVDNYPAIDFAGYELRQYSAINLGINGSLSVFKMGLFKTAIISGINYRINAIEDINSHPSNPSQRSTDINVNGIGAQIGIREIFRFKNGMELWGTAKYNRNFNGEFTVNILSFDLNLGIPISIDIN